MAGGGGVAEIEDATHVSPQDPARRRDRRRAGVEWPEESMAHREVASKNSRPSCCPSTSMAMVSELSTG